MALLTDVADRIVGRESLQATLEFARAESLAAFTVPAAGSRLLAELSALRRAIVDVWPQAPSGVRDRVLQAAHAAIDVMIAATVQSHDESLRVRSERLDSERERALEKLESLLAASPVGIAFLDPDLRYLRINEALAAVNGRPAAEHIGRSIMEMLPEAAHVIEPMLRQVMRSGQPVINRELTRSPADGAGEPRTFFATFFPVRAKTGHVIGVGGIVADITETKRAEHDLQRLRERMQSILEHTPASIWVKDDQGRIVLANHRLADALGHRYEDVMGRRSEDLLPADVAAQHLAHDAIVIRENRAVETEEVVPGPNGKRTFLSIKFPLPGDPPMVGGIATEISDRKRMEEELHLAVESREKVLAAVSHDLRSPLSTIQFTSATLMRHLADDQRWRRHLEIIHRSCRRMDHLISDLLDMVSIDAGRLSIEMRPERANDVLREAFELHQVLGDEKKIAMTLRALDRDVFVQCDRQRLLQVFENLIGNALKFCRAGDAVTLGGERREGDVCFWVEDTGPGISRKLLPHLFDPYWSGPDARNGVGLGLYISRGIVERHGGQIEVRSGVDHGARFSFTIAVAEAAPSSIA